MTVNAMLVLALGMVAMTGCAGQRAAQEINRLRSDVALLDQRVSQLERASLTAPSVTEWPTEPQIQPSTPEATTPTKSAPSAQPRIKPTKTEIQQALKNAGFYQGPIDGKIGSLTREAIRQFQQVHGLTVDGVVGRQTWVKLQPYLDLSAGSGEAGAAETLK